jgi:hypothetical protein
MMEPAYHQGRGEKRSYPVEEGGKVEALPSKLPLPLRERVGVRGYEKNRA